MTYFFYACGGQKFRVFSFMLVYMTHLGKHKTLNVGAPAAKYSVFRFMLVYRTHLGKHKTLNVGAAATTSFYFYAYIQDASRQAQNSKCWRAASAKKLHFRDIAEEIYI